MKLTSAYVVVCVGFIAKTICVVQAETMFRMIFNNGTADPSMSCTAEENALISQVFNRPLNRRNLRSSSGADDQPVDLTIASIQEAEQIYVNNGDRELAESLAYCTNQCQTHAKGFCYVSGCAWYNAKRRQLQNYAKGFLSNSTYCQITSDSITSDLNYLVSQSMVSSSCIALLNAPRKLECYEDVMYGIVDSFKVIDADIDTALISFLNARQTICNINAFNFQVTVNPCVNSVNITLYNRRAKYHASVVRNTTVPGPFTIFGMNGTSSTNFNGGPIPLGNFTIEATPNGNTNKTRVRNFIIAEC